MGNTLGKHRSPRLAEAANAAPFAAIPFLAKGSTLVANTAAPSGV